MVVIGATPIDEAISAEQREGLYLYDDCLVEFAPEVTEDVAPVLGFTEDKTFYIARVRNTGTELTIQDKRTDFWSFNVVGIADKLDKSQNLADLTDKSIARANLEVWGKIDSDSRYMKGASNLSDLQNDSDARDNLGVYSTGQVNDALALRLAKGANLLDIPDKPQARFNLGVNTLAETVAAVGERLLSFFFVSDAGVLSSNLGLTVTTSKLGTGYYRVVHNLFTTHGVNLYWADIQVSINTTIKLAGVRKFNDYFEYNTADDASANDVEVVIKISDISYILP
jgi:hypothetical protein